MTWVILHIEKSCYIWKISCYVWMDYATYEWESVAVCCRVLQGVAVGYSAYKCVARHIWQGAKEKYCIHRSHDAALHRVDVCWSVLKCFEVCCSVVQGAAVRCQRVALRVAAYTWVKMFVLQCVAMCCNVLQCVAACSSALQRVAVFWSLLQRNIANTWIKIRGSFHTIAFPDSNQALFKSCRFRWGFRWFRSGSGWERQTRAVMAWVYVRVLARLQVIQGLD